MLSVSMEMDEKSTTLLNTILTSPNESEATNKINLLLKNCAVQPAYLNNYILNTTPLFAAIDKGYIRTAELLIKSGANPNLPLNKEGFTPLTKIAYESNTKFIESLAKNGANLNLCDNRGFSPLTTAVHKNFIESTSLLLALGAKINNKDILGKNPLNYARENANKDMVTLLRSKRAIRCWLHEFLGKGDELKGFEKKEKSLTKKLWNYVADNHSLFAGIGAIFATRITGLCDGFNYSYNGIRSMFKSNNKTIGQETIHYTKIRRSSNNFRITKEDYSLSKSQSKNMVAHKTIERQYSPGQRPDGYDIKNRKPAFALQKHSKDLAS